MPKTCAANANPTLTVLTEEPIAANSAKTATNDIDTQFLSSLIGYNARRTSLMLMGAFTSAVEGHALKVVEFSMLSLIKANPGITNSALCNTLGLLPPNAVGMIQSLIRQGFVSKLPHLLDGRAYSLFCTAEGQTLTATLETRLIKAERARLKHITAKEQRQLIALLKKTYGH